ncbi:MAG: hypothetical protein QHH13_05160 [Melioribacter sp.]|uniref:hypothetical protein n=1 Tax=Rosettibacter primus TaxID=3111523 RepID=UPI00247E8925|nr:hypothetical protein [Melioribacter sp.]
MIEQISQLIQEGKFNSAIKLCEEKINSSNLEDRVHFKEEKNLIERYYKDFVSNSIGETYLPLVDTKSRTGRILKIKSALFNDNQDDVFINDEWKTNAISIVKEFMNNYIKKEFPELLILDWDFSEIVCGVKKNSYLKNNYDIQGRSYILPLILSFISLLIEEKLPENICFTGDIEKINNKYFLKKVDGIDIKQKIINEELPFINDFIHPENSNAELAEIVKKNLNITLEKILKSPFIKRYILLEKNSAQSKYGSHKIISIKINGSISIDDFIKLPEYLHANINYFKDEGNGIIIDGRAPISVYTMITSFPEIINSLPNFLAVTYSSTQNVEDNLSKTAIVIRTSQAGMSKLKPGQILNYKIT